MAMANPFAAPSGGGISTAGQVGIGVGTGGAGTALNALSGGQLYGGAGTNLPQNQIAQLDPATQGLINQQRAQAAESTNQIAGETMAGAQARGQGAVNGLQNSLNQRANALGMSNPANLSAQLQARAQRGYQGNIASLQNQANMNAGNIQLSREQQALQNEAHLNQIHTQAYNTALQNEQAKRDSRNQLISSIFGFGGSVAGSALGHNAKQNSMAQQQTMMNQPPPPSSSPSGPELEAIANGQ